MLLSKEGAFLDEGKSLDSFDTLAPSHKAREIERANRSMHMMSVLRGRKVVSQFLTKGREFVWIWYQQGGRGSKIPKNYTTSYF